MRQYFSTILKAIHRSEMSIIQKFLTNQIATNEIDAILSHTSTLVAYAKRGEFTKFEDFWSIKMSWIPKFSLKLLSDTLQ